MALNENETVVWKENYFMHTANIYEPRGPKYRCTECDEIFNTRLSILTHSQMHLKPFCVVCGIYTQDAKEMQNHMKCDHRSMVKIIPIRGTDENHNQSTTSSVETNDKTSQKKQKVQPCKRIGSNGQIKNGTSSTRRVVSRFGRCIKVKLPDF